MKHFLILIIGIYTLVSAQSTLPVDFASGDRLLVEGSGQEDDLVIDPGSGSTEEPITTKTTVGPAATTTVTSISPRFGAGGDDEPEDNDFVFNYSGSGLGITNPVLDSVECNNGPSVQCWCVDENGKEIDGTRVFLKKPDCSAYKATHAPDVTVVITTDSPLPMRPSSPNKVAPIEQVTETATELTHKVEVMSTTRQEVKETTVKETTAKMVPTTEMFVPVETDAVEYYPSTPKWKDLPISIGEVKPTGYKVNIGTIGNKIPSVAPPKDIDDEKEEETNIISGTGSQVGDKVKGPKIQPVNGNELFTHPGILAAVIAGGVVGLLCTVLCVMFIVYRMRKKDEGSYPLDDSKPPRLHTYTQPSSREFYA